MEKTLCDEYYVAQAECGQYMLCVDATADAWYLTGLESATELENSELDVFTENTSDGNQYTEFHGEMCRLVKVRRIIESEPVYKETKDEY